MRVIAGEFRSRKLLSLPGMDVRPTPDRLRETLFNILQGEIEDAVFVDAYAGTGSVGIEALSRGARHVIFLEKDREAVEVIKQNLAALRIGSRARVLRGLASTLLTSLDADMVFADPPYPKEREYQAVLDALEEKPPKLLVLQHAARFHPAASAGDLNAVRALKQGENALTFYRVA